ncbi:MAG: YbhB/YbcL family Raf kinase inhibitor-like protein [Actinomycetota bacterium]
MTRSGSMGTTRAARTVAGLILAALLPGCADEGGSSQPGRGAPRLRVTGSGFSDGDTIPTRYTCDGGNVSPALRWEGVPDAGGYALTMVDPDAPGGTFVHWVAVGIPSTHVPRDGLPKEAWEGANGSGAEGYTGPCPPEGDEPHRYVFTVYALSGDVPEVEGGASLEEVLTAIECCVEARGVLTGRYGR